MQRIQTLLQKLSDLSKSPNPELIDVDLMMDYTRVIYSDLVEMRNRLVFTGSLPSKPTTEPTKVPDTTPDTTPAPIPRAITPPPAAPDPAPYPVPSQKHSVQNMIGINDTYLFISELFDNDKEAYQNTIATLDSFDDYQLAEQWLHSHYTWDADSPTVQEFMNILDAFYNRP